MTAFARSRPNAGVWCTFVLTCWLPLVAGCGKRLSSAECDTLLDHYTSRLVLSENPDASPFVIAEKQHLARELAHSEPQFEFEACDEDVSRRQFECAMAAADVNSIEQCLTL